MAYTKGQRIAALAHRYIDSLRMWATEDDEEMWTTWAAMMDLGSDTNHVRRVVDVILEKEGGE